MNEIQALAQLDEALSSLEDDSTRLRVLHWAINKYGDGITPTPNLNQTSPTLVNQAPIQPASPNVEPSLITPDSKEMPGIAMITDSGEFRLIVRDIKAKNTNDAAIRLAVVAIRAHCQLSGESSTSSRRIVKPILENWRAYTGNTRATLSSHKGIIRNGDALSLDQHAKAEADEYIQEILDPETTGSWNPTSAVRKRKRKSGDSVRTED